MTDRSGRSTFEPGENVLCFEPDTTKARVLYDARVLDVCFSKDCKNVKKCGYHIHFQGWNSSWDRVVPESFVLKDTESNRQLMRKLAQTARYVRKNKVRRRQIMTILKGHFRSVPRFESWSDDASSSSDSDDDDDDDDDSNDSEDDDDDDDEDYVNDDFSRLDDDLAGEDERGGIREDADEDKENAAGRTTADVDAHKDVEPVKFELPLPENLRQKLEDDCFYVKEKDKLVNLPAPVSVISVLEEYERQVRTADPHDPGQHKRTAARVALVREVMDGLRIFFDFSVADILLYDSERAQYALLTRTNETAEPESRRRRHSGRLSASANEAKVAYPAANRVKVEPADTDSGDDGGDDEDGGLSTRRMTRHAYAEEIRRARTKDDDASDAGPTRRGSLRRRSRSGTEHAHQGEPADGGDDDAAPARSVSDAVRTAWRLVPPEVIRGGGDAVAATMPSALYGCQHLLRLFVRLPALLSEMNIPRQSHPHLQQQLRSFIEYVSDHSERLLPEAAYVYRDDWSLG